MGNASSEVIAGSARPLRIVQVQSHVHLGPDEALTVLRPPRQLQCLLHPPALLLRAAESFQPPIASMEHVDAITKGEPPKNPDRMVSVKVAGDTA